MKLDFDSLSEEEQNLVNTMRKLHAQGIDSAMVDCPEHNRILFPNGVSTKQYNSIVPNLVQKGILASRYDASRDGPLLRLTKAAKDFFGDSEIQHNKRMQSDAAEPRR